MWLWVMWKNNRIKEIYMKENIAQISDGEIAEKIFKRINLKRLRPWQGEEEVRIAYVSAIEEELQIHFDAERIKKDSSYNNIIIEFKAPGFFNGSKSSSKFIEATEQRLFPYIKKESKRTGIPEEDFIGIAIDGEHICFAKIKNSKLQTQHLLEFSPHSINFIIQAIGANTRKAITTDNLLADFGHGSKNARFLMQAFADGLASELQKSGNSKIKMLFEEWKSLYGQVSDMSVLQIQQIENEISFAWHGDIIQGMSGRLFVIHTYNSLLIKLLAAEIVSGHDLSSIKNPAEGMAAILDNKSMLSSILSNIEHAGIFQQAGIKGFVEEVIFSWYIDIAETNEHGDKIIKAIRNLLVSVSLYQTDRLRQTRDVLRDLYQGLVPGRLRQSLGEFYTPDWLVDWTVSRAKNGSWLNKRVLDPTCGSGAFLISILRLKISEAKIKGISSEDIIKLLCTTTWGFDLNPLAVQTARVNFLMEIAPLLEQCPGIEIEVPVLLADAIYSPAANPKEDETIVKYQIGSQIAGLDIHLPATLAFDRVRLDAIFNQMAENVEANLLYSDSNQILLNSSLITKEEAIEWQPPLEHTYNQILELHRKQWNGIWFRIVRNFFWSATAGKFDTIVGNPPWVRWSKLPELYRQRVKPTCEQYGIFSDNKRHGGNELDISAMITYTTADKWLKQEGKLVFVITGTIFKNPSSAGFRKFQIDSTTFLVPIMVDDFKALKPFPDASNHTSVVVIDKKSKKVIYPIPYNLWRSKTGQSRNINSTQDLKEVQSRIVVSEFEAAPVGDIGSPWAVLDKGRYDILKSLSGVSKLYEGRKGITADLNGVFFVPIIQNNGKLIQIKSRPEAGRKDIGLPKNAWVEPNLIYPLIKGAGDFEACYLKLDKHESLEKLYTFLPNHGISNGDYKSAETEMNKIDLKNTKQWFNSFKPILKERSTYRRQMKGAPFYAVYNVGDYTFKPWKVVWPEMSSKFYAAVVSSTNVPLIGERPYIPDHKIYYCSFDTKEHAYFLCGLLNSKNVTEWIESHNISIQVGNIFKHLNLPRYDDSDKNHKELTEIVRRIHTENNKSKRNILLESVNELSEMVLKNQK